MSAGSAPLFVPGSSPAMIARARDGCFDTVVLDLEDAVGPTEKDSARARVTAALGAWDRSRLWVRVNPSDSREFDADLDAILTQAPDAIVLPKADMCSLAALDRRLDGTTARRVAVPRVVALVETCLGVVELVDMCRASAHLGGLLLGAEDLATDLGVRRTEHSTEVLLARQHMVMAAHAFRLHAIDTPYTAIDDLAGLAEDAAVARGLGFGAKACVHPAQVPVVQEAFRVTDAERRWAERVVAAYDESVRAGAGACAVDGRMIDAPVAERARRILAHPRGR